MKNLRKKNTREQTRWEVIEFFLSNIKKKQRKNPWTRFLTHFQILHNTKFIHIRSFSFKTLTFWIFFIQKKKISRISNENLNERKEKKKNKNKTTSVLAKRITSKTITKWMASRERKNSNNGHNNNDDNNAALIKHFISH